MQPSATNRISLQPDRHMKSVHMGKKFQCPECEYQFTQKSNLDTQQNSVHMGQKYECPEWLISLDTRHKSVHMGLKFECPECERQFTLKGTLVAHHKCVKNSNVLSVNISLNRKVT